MSSILQDLDSSLADLLHAHTDSDPNFWDFERNSKRSNGHGLLPYPAMMVPQLQGALLDDLLIARPGVKCCYDPFGGSGTVLTECVRRGLDFVGGDLNPLAVLAMAVKATPPETPTLEAACTAVLKDAETGELKALPPATPYAKLEKWFTPEVLADLSTLRAAIRRVKELRVRRFLWVCLAATVRQCSNSRTSTFKLHVYSEAQLAERDVDVLRVFARFTTEGTTSLTDQHDDLKARGLLDADGQHRSKATLFQGDVLTSWSGEAKADVLMTSPPYGDNRTTVPYGQFSFLPLLWIDPEDWWDGGASRDLIGSPYRIDVASLGGRTRPKLDTGRERLSRSSPAFESVAKKLDDLEGDGLDRLMAFAHDLDASIGVIHQRLKPGAIQFWTLGNRRISGVHIPTSTIVSELVQARGGSEVTSIQRKFPRNAKRMASRNSKVDLMDSETILVLSSPLADPA